MLKLLSFFTGGWQSYVAAGLLSAGLAAAASWYVTSLPYKAEIATMRAERAEQSAADAKAALSQFVRQADNITAAANRLTELERGFDGAFSTFSRDFQHYAQAAPLPPDCKPDAFRLRILSSAVAAANSAATGREVSGGLPANH